MSSDELGAILGAVGIIVLVILLVIGIGQCGKYRPPETAEAVTIADRFVFHEIVVGTTRCILAVSEYSPTDFAISCKWEE